MPEVTLREATAGWSDDELQNLLFLLTGTEQRAENVRAALDEAFKWAYWSRTKSTLMNAADDAVEVVKRLFAEWGETEYRPPRESERWGHRETPSYSRLLKGACQQLGLHEEGLSREQLETRLVQKVLADAIANMTPEQREAFASVHTAEVFARAGIQSNELGGPLAALGALTAAQLSGFGVYLAATSALSAVTSAVGITLPFAAYTGLTSAIALAISPVGFVAVGAWGASRVMDTEWKRIVPALVLIIATNERHKRESE